MDAIFDYVIESLRRYTALRAWFAWWHTFDNAGSFADDAVALAISLTAIIEGSFMFLAKKRIAIAREDGREEGRAEVRAELEPIIRDLQERIQRLENGGLQQSPATDATP